MSTLGGIILVVSLGTLPLLLFYRPMISPIRNALGILIGTMMFGIPWVILRSPLTELASVLLRIVFLVFFIIFAGVGSHAMRYGFSISTVEVPLLFSCSCVFIGLYIMCRTKWGRRVRAHFRIR